VEFKPPSLRWPIQPILLLAVPIRNTYVPHLGFSDVAGAQAHAQGESIVTKTLTQRLRVEYPNDVNPADAHEAAAEIERLRAALTRYGQHDSHGMSDQPGCQKARMGGGTCTCGLERAMS
jgi:hypothetical protein